VPLDAVRLLAVLMGATHSVVWVLGSRWERPGRKAHLRASLRRPPLAGRGAYAALLVPLLYPVVAVIAPAWTYEGPLNWSSAIDAPVQGVGLALWAVSVIVLVSAARALGGYLSQDGVTEDHEVVASGPYRYVRHPIYGAFTANAAGLGLVFRSYLLLGVAAVWLAGSLWWTRAEEAMLSSPEGLGEAYRVYRDGTGRFLPRLRRTRG
jgi:protein-S-isoprenylcysteine O-methyltransferase Ste14